MSALRRATEYLGRGWSAIPVPYKSKKPTLRDWPKLRITAATVGQYFNSEPQNIGVLLGKPSGGLVDIDIDCQEAEEAARFLLPASGSVFGRAGAARSHHLFVADCPTKKFAEPGRGGATLIELRSTGCQTVFPGSVHPSGELIDWDTDNGPSEVEGKRLGRLVGLTAAAALIARHWPAESRHDAALALAGALKRTGWGIEQASLFVKAVVKGAGDEEAADRERACVDTYSTSTPTTGWPRLKELLGGDVIGRVSEWLGVTRHLDREQAPVEAYEGSGAHLPIIKYTPGELPRNLDAAEAALLLDEHERIYQQGSILVRTARIPERAVIRSVQRTAGALGINPMDKAYLIERATASACWKAFNKKTGKWVSINCPVNIAEGLLSRSGRWRFPVLTAITESPTLIEDGRVLDCPGHNKETGVLFDPELPFFPTWNRLHRGIMA